jgi:transcriptional regulator NrdR family protein
MICPYCNCRESDVLHVWQVEAKRSTIRRRECLKCKGRYTTLETVKSTNKIYAVKPLEKNATA